jgi:hypothetical protein
MEALNRRMGRAQAKPILQDLKFLEAYRPKNRVFVPFAIAEGNPCIGQAIAGFKNSSYAMKRRIRAVGQDKDVYLPHPGVMTVNFSITRQAFDQGIFDRYQRIVVVD